MLIFIQCFMVYYFSRELVFYKWLVLFNENRAAYFYILCILEKYFSSQPRKKMREIFLPLSALFGFCILACRGY